MTVVGLSVLTSLLVIAGVEKVADPKPLAAALRVLVPPLWRSAAVAARLLAWAEVAVGVLLLFAVTRRPAILAAMALAVAFAAAGAIAQVRRLRVDCGCFGSLIERSPPLGTTNIAIAAVLLAAGSAALLGPDLSAGQEAVVRLLSLSSLLAVTSTGAVLRVLRPAQV